MASSVSSTLKLIIEKGPRKGETLEFNPRSTIRLGRVARGNNLPIKDPGISSKHLSIEFNSNSSKWLITDLDSSNGTLLNSSQIEPLSPFELNNGDEIKIGELTSIRVEIVEISGEISVRRNPRRQGGAKSGVDLGVKVEVEVGEGNSVRVRDLKGEDEELGRENRRGRGRGRSKRVDVVEDGDGDGGDDGGSLGVSENVDNVKVKQGGGVGTRRTRSSKRDGDEVSGQVELMPPARRTRKAKNVLGKVPESEALDGVDCKEAESVVVVENKKRGGHGRKKKVESECVDKAADVVVEDMKNEEVLEVGVPSVSVQACEERVEDAAEHDMVEKSIRNVSELEVPKQEECVVVVGEQHREEPIDDSQKTVVDGTNRVVVDVREQTCEEQVDDTPQCNMLEETNTDVSEVEVSEQAECVGVAAEQTCEEPTDDTQKIMLRKTNREVSELPVASVSEYTCEEQIDDTALQNIVEETNRDALEVEVPEQAGGVLVAEEKPREEPTNDTHKITLEKTNREALELPVVSAREQTCEEQVDDTPQRNMIEETNRDVSEVEVPELAECVGVAQEQTCEEPTDDTQKIMLDETTTVVSELPVTSVREHTCEEWIDDSSLHNIFEGTNRDVLEVEIPEQAGGVLVAEEQPREVPTYDTHKTTLEESNREALGLPVASAREQTCDEQVDDTVQYNMFEEANRDVSGLEVSEQVGGVSVAREQPCEEPTDDTQKTMLEKTHSEESETEVPEQAGDILDAGTQPCTEPMDKTGQRNESILSASQFEQVTYDELESDLLLEDGEAIESDMGEISKELDADADGKEKGQEVREVPDLETMTLGEWFDYLEVYLPKQINDVTDEIITDMRKRAKQFNDFMSQQQNDKGKLPLAT